MQAIIQSGQPPTVLQQLCQLPFHYFSDPRLINVLFPTLISCCYHCQSNREILEQELSCDLLANFIEVMYFTSFFIFFCSESNSLFFVIGILILGINKHMEPVLFSTWALLYSSIYLTEFNNVFFWRIDHAVILILSESTCAPENALK